MEVKPLTEETWDDFLTVMGPKGGDAGCFCMYYRQTGREFKENSGEPNRSMMRDLISQGLVPGLIGYAHGQPIGWVAVGPKDWYGRLARSPIARPVDSRPAWSVTCFVIPKEHRRSGVGTALLGAAVGYARSQGAEVVEGYPMDPPSDSTPAFWAWMGFTSMFLRSGFLEAARHSPTRPLMRLELVASAGEEGEPDPTGTVVDVGVDEDQ